MPVCAVPMCATTHRTTDQNVTLYRFPKDDNYARIWVRCCMKKDTFNTKSAFICSLHFAAEAYQRDINHELLGISAKKSLRKDAVPTLLLPSLGMLRKNSVEALNTENLTSYYKAEKRLYPEWDSLLVDLMPGLSPKSFMTRKMSSFSCGRKNKCRAKLSSLRCSKKSTSSVVQMSDTTEKKFADSECISEDTVVPTYSEVESKETPE